MLERVLLALAAGGAFRMDGLARQLGITPALLAAMLEKLEQMGYLAPLPAGCSGGCSSCASGGSCAIIGDSKVWALSEKGRRAAERDKCLTPS
jgi:hypothetical protein